MSPRPSDATSEADRDASQTPDDRFERAARSEDVRFPEFTEARVRGREVLLSRLNDGTPVAFGTICPHQKNPLKSGRIWEGEVDCPYHHYTYDPVTGENRFPKRVSPAFRREQLEDIEAFEVREDDGWLWVGPQRSPSG